MSEPLDIRRIQVRGLYAIDHAMEGGGVGQLRDWWFDFEALSAETERLIARVAELEAARDLAGATIAGHAEATAELQRVHDQALLTLRTLATAATPFEDGTADASSDQMLFAESRLAVALRAANGYLFDPADDSSVPYVPISREDLSLILGGLSDDRDAEDPQRDCELDAAVARSTALLQPAADQHRPPAAGGDGHSCIAINCDGYTLAARPVQQVKTGERT